MVLYSGVHSDIVYQDCVDVDECLENNGRCDPNAFCHNTIVSTRRVVHMQFPSCTCFIHGVTHCTWGHTAEQ